MEWFLRSGGVVMEGVHLNILSIAYKLVYQD